MTCVFRGTGNGRCGGRPQRHHVFPKQRIKRAFPYGAYRLPGETGWRKVGRFGVDYENDVDIERRTLGQIIADDRNLMDTCKDHHDRVTGAALRTGIPESVWEFCREFGFAAQLENDLGRQR